MLKKVVIIGPESTGKSTLCTQLAAQYNTLWCPEYARDYLLEHGMSYTFDDLLTIAKGQLALEDSFAEEVRKSGRRKDLPQETIPLADFPTSGLPGSLLFIDTDMYVMKVWCEFVFGKCHRFILEQIVERKYDLYLLCNIDLPWTQDELREYPDIERRRELYAMYKDIMINQDVQWIDISGNHEKRLASAVEGVNKIL